MFNSNLMKFILYWNSKFYDSEYKDRKLKQSKSTIKTLNGCLAYFAAFDAYISWILEESRFYSKSLVLDSMSEVEASFSLSANFYYKQAVQMLRNYLELIVAQYYFSSNTSLYKDWRTEPDFRMPRFRGKKGMIKYLRKNNKINLEEENKLDYLFGTLSAYTHSKYEKLVHVDPKTGNVILFDFNKRYLEEWIDLAIECIEIGLIVLSKHAEDWEKQLDKDDDLVCPTCHKKDFEIAKEKYGKKELFLYTCKKCNGQIRTDIMV